MTTKTNTNPWLMDSRVRERNLRSGALTEKDLEKNLAALPDLEGQYDSFSTPQPALEQPRVAVSSIDDSGDLDDESDSDLGDDDDSDSDLGDESSSDVAAAAAAPVEEAPAPAPVAASEDVAPAAGGDDAGGGESDSDGGEAPTPEGGGEA